MATERDKFCDLCHEKHITKVAEEYCPKCDEAFCVDCRDHHKLSKATKCHATLKVEDYYKLPTFIRTIKQYCDDHGDAIEFLCPNHDSFCCRRCIITSHSDCKGICVIDDLIKTTSSSSAFDVCQKSLKDIQQNTNVAIQDRKRNLDELIEQKAVIIKHVKETREKINNHLDSLEQKLLQELLVMENTNKHKIANFVEDLQKVHEKTTELQKNIELIEKYATSSQIFLGIKELQEQISVHEQYLRALADNGFNRTEIVWKMNDKLNVFTEDVRSFGNIEQKDVKSPVTFSWQLDHRAQILTARRIDFENMVLKQKYQIGLSGNITGCTMMHDGGMLFTSHNESNVIQYDGQGQYVSMVHVPIGNVFDIVLKDNQTVLVSGGIVGNNLYEIDVDTMSIKRTIDTQDWCYGLTYQTGIVKLCSGRNGIRIIDIATEKIDKFPTFFKKYPLNWCTYITSDDYYVYHSDHNNDSVTCYDLNGKIVWLYRSELMQKPQGITIDDRSNLYVAGSASNNVIIISPDGKRAKEILGPTDGIKDPRAIHFEKWRNSLLVANYNGPAFLFTIS